MQISLETLELLAGLIFNLIRKKISRRKNYFLFVIEICVALFLRVDYAPLRMFHNSVGMQQLPCIIRQACKYAFTTQQDLCSLFSIRVESTIRIISTGERKMSCRGRFFSKPIYRRIGSLHLWKLERYAMFGRYEITTTNFSVQSVYLEWRENLCLMQGISSKWRTKSCRA